MQLLAGNYQQNKQNYKWFAYTICVYLGLRILLLLKRKFSCFKKYKKIESIFSVLRRYKYEKQNARQKIQKSFGSKQQLSLIQQNTVEMPKHKLLFDCHEFLFENTCLQELKDSNMYVLSNQIYRKVKKQVKQTWFNFLIFVIENCTEFIFPLQFLLYYIKYITNDPNINQYSPVYEIPIMIFGYLRLYTNMFLVSFMSSRRQFLKVSSDSFENKRWIYKRIKYHLYRSFYLTTTFQLIKNAINVGLTSQSDDNFEMTKYSDCQLNIVILSIYIVRYVILFVVMDFNQSTKQHIVQNNDLVYKQQKKLWFIQNFMHKYLPNTAELERIVEKHHSLKDLEEEIEQRFDSAYEDFDREVEIIKNIKCKSIVVNKSMYKWSFTFGVFYIFLQSVGFIIIYSYISYTLFEMGVVYQATNVKMSPSNFIIQGLYMVEIVFLPPILKRIIQIDSLFDSKALQTIFQENLVKQSSNVYYTKQKKYSQQIIMNESDDKSSSQIQ